MAITTITRVSTDSAGLQFNGSSFAPSVSANGGLTAFYSGANPFVAGEPEGYSDVFVKNTQSGHLALVSGNYYGTQGNQGSIDPTVSADGRFVAFYGGASDLVYNARTNCRTFLSAIWTLRARSFPVSILRDSRATD